MTREQITADGERFEEPMRSVYFAFGEHHSGFAVERCCPFCKTPIRVRALSDSAWQSECDCGRCNDTLRGL